MKDLRIEKTKSPKPKTEASKLVFGKEFTDHMFEVDWTKDKGWGKPTITPYHKLELDPSCTVFHYASQCFEGMKAFKDSKGKIRLFRPEKNYDRLMTSVERLVLPKFSYDSFLSGLKAFIREDASWVPEGRGYSLYLRPTVIGTQDSLGVAPSFKAKYFVIASPVGPYYPEGWKAVKLLADDRNVRSWPGGTGNVKIGGNYAGGILPQVEAQKKGYSQVLWLLNDTIAEAGTMNIFIHLKNEKGENELITPPLDDIILPGVTRDSIVEIAKKIDGLKVSQRNINMTEFIKAIEDGRLYEAFGAGTAAVVSPIKAISYKGKEYAIPLDASDPNAGIGKMAKRMADSIMDIQYGVVENPWSMIVD
eukprot:TRINITY_DN8056_c0_g1_i1.p1 TRINITY_DN8056_c0_g1~~TRINITY_DN8056_c0_g1_i1.p1  ORF type:complete len:407 (-),score=116.36 TRINITY_DN8056_c0_g1_i1:8-1096(-)